MIQLLQKTSVKTSLDVCVGLGSEEHYCEPEVMRSNVDSVGVKCIFQSAARLRPVNYE